MTRLPRGCGAIDHVVVRTVPADAVSLHGLLAGVFGLPVVWPLKHEPFGSYGWIGLGTTSLEIWGAARNDDLPPGCTLPLLHGIALDPGDLATALTHCEAAGLRCKPPRAWRTPDGQGTPLTNFTNAVLLDLSCDGCCVFFCEWGLQAPIVPWPHGVEAVDRRAAQQRALQAGGGGPLEVRGLAELVQGARDVARIEGSWRALTQCPEPTPLYLGGVQLQVVPAAHDALVSLGLAVASMDRARPFLQANGLLGDVAVGRLAIAPSAVGGLRLHCVPEPTTAMPDG